MGGANFMQGQDSSGRDMLRLLSIFLLVVVAEATPTIPTSVAGHVNSYKIGGVSVKDTQIGSGETIKSGDKVVMRCAHIALHVSPEQLAAKPQPNPSRAQSNTVSALFEACFLAVEGCKSSWDMLSAATNRADTPRLAIWQPG